MGRTNSHRLRLTISPQLDDSAGMSETCGGLSFTRWGETVDGHVVQIRRADEGDAGAVWELVERCREALLTAGIRQWVDSYPTRQIVERGIADGNTWMLAAGERCMATITLDDEQEPQYGSVPWKTAEPSLVVHRLCVDPALQGRGLGRRLMEHAHLFGRRHGYASVRLDAYSDNPAALELYRRLGYSEVGEVYFAGRERPFRCMEFSLSGAG